MPTLFLQFLANERPLINIDGTLFINIVLWIVLYFALKGQLFDPMQKLFSARESGTKGARTETGEIGSDINTLKERYDAGVKEARQAAAAAREELRTKAKQREAELVEKSRDRAATTIEQGRATMRTEREQLNEQIKTEIPIISREIVAKVLGREVQA